MTAAHEPQGWREEHAKQRDNGARKRTFTVVGETKVAGKSKGETVELEFSEAAIDALIQAGCIQEQGTRVEGFEPFAVPAELDPTVIQVVVVDDAATDKDLAGTPPTKTRATRAQTPKKG